MHIDTIKYCRFLLIPVIIFFMLGTDTYAQEKREIDFLILSNIFPEADSRDMQISFEMWATDLFKSGGLNYDINLVVISPEEYLNKNYDLEKTYMVVISSINYLKTRNDRYLEPFLFTSEDTSQTYAVIANNNFTNFGELAGKKISLTSTGFGEIAEFWLNYITSVSSGLTIQKYFSSVDSLDTESKCINSVFFNSSDACVIREDVYNLACELNPQIKNKTRIIERSEKLLHSILCLTGKFTPSEKIRFITAVRNMQNTERGKQILNLFKRTKLFEYHPENIENIENIYQQEIKSSSRN